MLAKYSKQFETELHCLVSATKEPLAKVKEIKSLHQNFVQSLNLPQPVVDALCATDFLYDEVVQTQLQVQQRLALKLDKAQKEIKSLSASQSHSHHTR